MTDTPPHQLVAAYLRGYLAERGISHMTAAGMVGMRQQNFSRRMLGATPFTVDELADVCRALGIDLGELVDGAQELKGKVAPRRRDAQKTNRPPERSPNLAGGSVNAGTPINLDDHRTAKGKRMGLGGGLLDDAADERGQDLPDDDETVSDE